MRILGMEFFLLLGGSSSVRAAELALGLRANDRRLVRGRRAGEVGESVPAPASLADRAAINIRRVARSSFPAVLPVGDDQVPETPRAGRPVAAFVAPLVAGKLGD